MERFKFATQSGIPGYGARVYVDSSEKHLKDFYKFMDILSAWGGIDKKDGDMVSWEMAYDVTVEAVENILINRWNMEKVEVGEIWK